MSRFFSIAATTVLLTGVALLIISSSIVMTMHLTEAKLNQSRSLPRGIYVPSHEPITYGTIVFFPLPMELTDYAQTFPGATSHFLDHDNGFLKTVVAMTDDTICRIGQTFSVNGHTLGDALLTGPNGAILPSWSGCHKLTKDELSVFSDRIQDSLDSRYYPTIKKAKATPYRPWIVIKE